eukprot:11190662-Prorocentrum_lima.AAC.1
MAVKKVVALDDSSQVQLGSDQMDSTFDQLKSSCFNTFQSSGVDLDHIRRGEASRPEPPCAAVAAIAGPDTSETQSGGRIGAAT